MGIWDALSDAVEALKPWTVVEAEAPVATEEAESNDNENGKDEVKSEEGEEKEEEEGGEDGEEEEEEDGEEEEEEEEIVDPKETIEQECKESKQCAPAKHHYDDCVERVRQQESEGEAKEDCVEEFFHLAHCATACAAPKLWSKLK